MARYEEQNYSLNNALANIGGRFLQMFQEELLQLAQDRNKTDIAQEIHRRWEGETGCNPGGTDIRIDWAMAIYDHGDWEKSVCTPAPKYRPKIRPGQKRQNWHEGLGYRCDNGMYVRSLSELCIANWLYANGISFEYERIVLFKEENKFVHCDFYLREQDIYLEFWGLEGDDEYDAYRARKEPLYRKYGLKLVSLVPEDLKDLRSNLIDKLSQAEQIEE